MIAKYLFRTKVNGRTVRVCRSKDDLPSTSRRYDGKVFYSCVVSTPEGEQVWVEFWRCEGVLYAVPYNGLEAAKLERCKVRR